MGLVIASFLFSMSGSAIGLHPALAGSGWSLLCFGLCQLPMATVSLKKLHKNKEILEVLMPRWGDLSLGIISATVLFLCTWAARLAVAPDAANDKGWLTKAYQHAGDATVLEKYWLPMLVAVLGISALEEIAWRGLVLPKIEELVGTRKAWPAAGLLYGLTFVPSIYWLRGSAGLNPLLVAAAVFAGVVWSYLVIRTRRLTPAILSHAVYIWFVVVQFRLMSLS